MTDLNDFADDFSDESWDDFSGFDDMEIDVLLVPDTIQDRGSEAVDHFIHRKVMKNMDRNVYNGDKASHR